MNDFRNAEVVFKHAFSEEMLFLGDVKVALHYAIQLVRGHSELYGARAGSSAFIAALLDG